MSDANSPPVAGWYPDPEDEAGDRWWNGVSWSDHRRPRNAPSAAASVPPVPVPPVAVPPVAVPPVTGTPAERPNPYAQPAYAAPPYAPPYAPNYAPATPMRNPAALGGMITSLVALLFNFILYGAPGIAGAIVSIVGLRKANQLIREGVTVGNGKAMAITGVAVGLAGAFLWDLFWFGVVSPLGFS